MRNLTFLLSVCTVDKSKVEISQNFVAFSEYLNFIELNSCYIFFLGHIIESFIRSRSKR